jgi:hypothetical protein
MFSRFAGALVCMLVAVTCSFAAELTPEQEKLYKQLEESLTGAALVGHFTVTGKDTDKPTPERYELASVKHIGDDNWMFVARIKYGKQDLTLPLTLPIRWAGDIPVITVDKIAFPGLGTYTARVMIYDDHYAGFWSGAAGKDQRHGGHLFGVVERNAVKAQSTAGQK